MQPEVGSAWVYKVSCSLTTENIHIFSVGHQSQTWNTSPCVSRKAIFENILWQACLYKVNYHRNQNWDDTIKRKRALTLLKSFSKNTTTVNQLTLIWKKSTVPRIFSNFLALIKANLLGFNDSNRGNNLFSDHWTKCLWSTRTFCEKFFICSLYVMYFFQENKKIVVKSNVPIEGMFVKTRQTDTNV